MGMNAEELAEFLIQERMQDAYAKWQEAEASETKKAETDRLESEYQEAVRELSEEQKDAIRHYNDSLFDAGAASDVFFYRLGVKDGIRAWKFMKKLMKTIR